MRTSTSRTLAALVLVAALAPMAQAGGPLILFDPATQTPYAWAPNVEMYTDLGGFGAVAASRADQITADAAATWTGVPTASFSASVVGDFASIGLPDITGANAGLVVGPQNGGGIQVMYDNDGTIISNFFGAPPGVLGIASPEYANGSTLTEGWMVMNGAAVNPGDLPDANSFAGVFTHEMGHAINMAHTQTNGAVVFFGDADRPGSCASAPYGGPALSIADTETMFPFIDPSPGSTGVFQADVDHPDDQTTLSDIYPAAGYPANFGTIEGRVFDIDGVSELTGVNVIARNLSDPYADAVSALTGDFTQGDLGPDGRFRLTGLTPGASYVVYVDRIVDGGFSTTPLSPLPALEEYWNAAESNLDGADPVCDFTSIALSAGQVFTADIAFNAPASPTIDVSPLSLPFVLQEGQSDSAPFTVTNAGSPGDPDLDWSIALSGSCFFLNASQFTGSLPVGDSDVVTVTVDATGLSPGTYVCNYTINSNDLTSPPPVVEIELTVVEASNPEINVFVQTPVTDDVAIDSRPDGSGRTLANALAWDGTPGATPNEVDATITVRLEDENGDPVVGFPAANIGLAAAAGGWAQCASTPISADAATDVNGETTISGALAAGGTSASGELMQVVVDDPTVASISYPDGLSGLRYFVNGPDVSGDLVTDLVDVGQFATAIAGGYDFAADLAYNGVLDLADVGAFATGLNLACLPLATAAEPTLTDAIPTAAPGAEMGVYFDADGTRASTALAPGTEAMAWVVVHGAAAERGVDALDVALRTSDNVRVLGREVIGAALDLSDERGTIAGFATARTAQAGSGLALMRVRLTVTDEEPASIWLEASDRSNEALPALASEGRVVTAMPVSGDVGLPVASLNAEVDDVVSTPRSLSLSVAPNPFNPATEIRFALPRSGAVELRIVNARGHLVAVLADGTMEAGEHAVTWNGTDRSGRTVGSGTYFSTLVTEAGTVNRKLMLIK